MTPSFKKPSSRSDGLTLIELLTVIAVIGILAAILLVVLGKAREKAHGATCLSNIRQVSLALLMYADENGGVLPTAADSTARASDWIHWRTDSNNHDFEKSPLVPYLGDDYSAEVFRCPGDEHIANGDPNPEPGWPPYVYSYSLNTGVSNIAALRGRVYNADDPSQIILLAEEANPRDGAAYLQHPFDRLTERHNGKGSVSFIDGHVAHVTPAFAADPVNSDPFYVPGLQVQ